MLRSDVFGVCCAHVSVNAQLGSVLCNMRSFWVHWCHNLGMWVAFRDGWAVVSC